MSEADYRVGYIGVIARMLGVILGVLFLIAGFIAYYINQPIYLYGYHVGAIYPYRDDSVGLFIAGAILLALGLAFSWRASMEAEKSAYVKEPIAPSSPELTQSVPRKYCRFCGAENKSDAVFCEKCGKQIA